jgi:subtilisin-like proprotein convertase family protein/uncharacterized protein YvpB
MLPLSKGGKPELFIKLCLLFIGLPVFGIFFTDTLYGLAQASMNSLPTENQPTPTGSLAPESVTPSATIPGSISSSGSITETALVTLSAASLTLEPAQEPPPTATSVVSTLSFFPIIIMNPTPTPVPLPVRILLCERPNTSIPDNNATGINRTLNISQAGYLVDLNIFVSVNHTWVGDLKISLRPPNSSNGLVLLDRPGVPASTIGCGNNHIQTIFNDQASQLAENKCASSPAAIGGSFKPLDSLDLLFGSPANGTYTINLADLYSSDIGTLSEWCLDASISSVPPAPTPTPPPLSVPSSAAIYGMSGQNQALPLDCESRSAVDWANFFGFWIGEIEFFNHLPSSDNPEKGFVGNVNGIWGQIPPNDYGVHAEPVAAVLRSYGLPAIAVKHFTWDKLRAEIAAQRPVIVWITGAVANGAPNYYVAASDGGICAVARYEHTVIVTGYTSSSVTFLDGEKVYSRSVDQFLDSWSSMQNMAVIAQP